jgi:DNA-binding winged helix-turn-helix (wHTH) protein
MCAAVTKLFGEFEFDGVRRRLTRRGRPIRLTGQALDLLWMLVDQPGELVTREEIKRLLWPGSGQDLDHSLDVLVNRLRRILGDSGKTPQYIGTVPRRGFRFLPVVSNSDSGDGARDQDASSFQKQQVRSKPKAFRHVMVLVAVVLMAVLGGILFARTRYNRFVAPQGPVRSAHPVIPIQH